MILRMPRSASALVVSFLLATLAAQATAQKCGSDAQSTISTDRPQITASSIVVPCGSLQFENGFAVTGNGGQQTTDFPETAVRFGIARKTELRFGVPNYFYNFDTGSGFTNGFGDLSLGFKQQLGPTPGKFDISLIPSVSLPTGANLISSHGYDPTVQLPWSRGLSNELDRRRHVLRDVANSGRDDTMRLARPACTSTASSPHRGTPGPNTPAPFRSAEARST